MTFPLSHDTTGLPAQPGGPNMLRRAAVAGAASSMRPHGVPLHGALHGAGAGAHALSSPQRHGRVLPILPLMILPLSPPPSGPSVLGGGSPGLPGVTP